MSDCTACRQSPPSIPVEIDNRPGLSAISYRIGTFSSFRAALLNAIHLTPELAGLRTRESDDYSITLMELWSAVADILTFYQERIANEAYLRTATLRDSVLRLVRLIGYQLRPGLAATTFLSFTLEKAAAVTIPVGLRVQSVPAGSAPPQKFETIESIQSDARFNSLSIFPKPETIGPLTPGRTVETVAPGADMAAFAATLATGDQLVAYKPKALEILKVAAVTVAGDRVRLQWAVAPTLNLQEAALGLSPASGLFKIGRTFRLFGQDAPSHFINAQLADSTDPTSVRGALAKLDDLTLDTQGFFLDGVYKGLKPGASLLINAPFTDGTQYKRVVIDSVTDKLAVRTGTTLGNNPCGVNAPGAATATNITAHDATGGHPLTSTITGATIYELIGPQLRLDFQAFPSLLSQPGLYLPGRRNGPTAIEVNRTLVKGVVQPGVTISSGDFPPGKEVIVVDANPANAMSGTAITVEIVGDNLRLSQNGNDIATVQALGLDPSVVQPVTALASPPFDTTNIKLHNSNSNLQLQVVIGQQPPQTVTFTKPSSLPLTNIAAALQKAIRGAMPDAPEFAQALVFNSADIVATGPMSLIVVPGVPGQSVAINPTALDPDTAADLGLDSAHVRYLDGVLSGPLHLGSSLAGSLVEYIGTSPLRQIQLFLSSVPAVVGSLTGNGILAIYLGGTTNRLLALPPVSQFERPAFFHLAIAPDGPFALDSPTAVLLGNVARASQGETVANEIVGSGDASTPFQTFSLRKKPVTFLLGNGPHGAQSTLNVAVNGVRWKEVASLYGVALADQVYVTRVADDGTLTLEFGDGKTGARVPTGSANIVATYRTGLGLAGRVGANKVTNLLDMPNGLKRGTNPVPADGGADPQVMADARSNAPSTVRTFGRAVSLLDFQDVALATGEIAKACATWVWTGFERSIFLTVAAQQGAKLSSDGIHQLWNTLLAERDPNHTLLVDNYVRVPILVSATLTVDPRYGNAAVQQTAFTALLSALSFGNLSLAQPIYLSHLYAVLQDVDGVLAVDIADLNFKNQDPAFRQAHGADNSKPQTRLFMLPARPGAAGAVLPAELAWIEIPSEDISISASGGSLN
jgi:hypothetical protein